MAQPGEHDVQSRQHQRHPVAIRDVGGMDDHLEQEALGVNEDMALAAVDFLAAVIAADPPFSVVLTL
jgi:hypothetical protein